MVIGQFIEAERNGWADDPAMADEAEQVTAAPGAGGMLLVPHREPGMDDSALPADYRSIMKIVAAASEPATAKGVSVRLGRSTTPGQVEPVRDKLKCLAERGRLHRAPAGRFTALQQPPARDRTRPDIGTTCMPPKGVGVSVRMNNRPAEGTEELVHQCRLPLSSATLNLVSGLVRGHLRKIRSR